MALGYFKYYGNVKLVPNYILSGDNAFLNLNTKNKLLYFKNKRILNYLKKKKIKSFFTNILRIFNEFICCKHEFFTLYQI